MNKKRTLAMPRRDNEAFRQVVRLTSDHLHVIMMTEIIDTTGGV